MGLDCTLFKIRETFYNTQCTLNYNQLPSTNGTYMSLYSFLVFFLSFFSAIVVFLYMACNRCCIMNNLFHTLFPILPSHLPITNN